VSVADLLLHVVLHLRMHGHTGRARRTAQRCRQTLVVADVLERLSHDTCNGNRGSRRHPTHHGTGDSSSSRTGDTTAVASLGFFEGDVDFSPPDASVTATTTMGGAPGAAVAVVVAAAVVAVAVGPAAISLALDSDADVVVVVVAAGAAAEATPRDDPRLRARCRGTATVAGAAARFDC
jgi:hypothetical protein